MSDACCGADSCETHAAPAAQTTVNRRSALLRVGISGLLILAGAAASAVGHPVLSLAGYLGAIAISAPTPAARAWRSIRARVLDINVLMIIAVAGAAALGDWFEAASVVWLFGIAQWLESRSLERARHAIRELVTLVPAQALVRRDGVERDLPAADVVPGDLVIVRPGGRIPIDGVLVAGDTTVDQSPVTGESMPVEKWPGDSVFAGTINGAAAIEIQAARPASDSTLARIIHLVEHAQSRRAPVQTFVDRFARRYTPAIVILAALVAFVPPLVGGWANFGPNFATWSYRALALLVVGCPCALVISTPVSIVSALTAAARKGVLIKGGSHLERLGAVKCVAFDKTGTLTAGRVTVTDVLAVEGVSTDGLLAVAAATEARSEHPIGRAILSRARSAHLTVTPGESFRALPGLGAEATVSSAHAIVGNHRLFEERQLCTPSLHAHIDAVEGRGSVPVLVGHNGAAIGVLGLTDEMRESGRHVVSTLHAEGIAWVVLLTGDRWSSAETVRDGVGLDEAFADLLPADKVDHVERLRRRYGPVAMVGDGINDAPALAAADVGIAMGQAGTGVALETADVALMTDDLERLPYALRLGRATLSNIRWNVGLALGMKLAFVVLAVSGMATLWMAIVADTGASLLVTASSLRLLRVK
ncbi:MAG: heavy metal translocating P-type ATPase [Acidobacteriota bacterium]